MPSCPRPGLHKRAPVYWVALWGLGPPSQLMGWIPLSFLCEPCLEHRGPLRAMALQPIHAGQPHGPQDLSTASPSGSHFGGIALAVAAEHGPTVWGADVRDDTGNRHGPHDRSVGGLRWCHAFFRHLRSEQRAHFWRGYDCRGGAKSGADAA